MRDIEKYFQLRWEELLIFDILFQEQQRVCPQGEDLMSGRYNNNGQQRRVRFVSPANRVRMLSGASDGDDEQSITQEEKSPQVLSI